MVFFGQFLYEFDNKTLKNMKNLFAIVKKSTIFLRY
jgi:hypothetical protein